MSIRHQRSIPGFAGWYQYALVIAAAILVAACAIPAMAQETYGTPGIATQHTVVNFSEVAVQGAMAPDVRSEPETAPLMPLPINLQVPNDANLYHDLTPPIGDTPGPLVPSPGTAASFFALGDPNTNIPPDTYGTVGPNHLMITLNPQVRIQDRTGVVISTVTLNSFWSSLGSPTAFDPKVLYDPYGNRWIFVSCANSRSVNSALLIGVSQTNDPTGAWNLYKIDADPSDVVWADFPSVGFNKDRIVVQLNMYTVTGSFFSKSNIYAFNKANLYAGGAGVFTLMSSTEIGGIQAPAITYDDTLATTYLVQDWNGSYLGNGYLRIHTITGDVGSEVLTLGPYVSTPNPWDFMPNVGNADFAPQLGSINKIMTNDSRMQNCVYRNGSLWCTQTVFLPAGAATRSAIQWWQLTPEGGILQRGLIDDPSGNTFYAFPSIAVNRSDHAVIGYSRFSASQYASGYYSFRSLLDSPNTFREDTVLKAGEAPYYKTYSGTRNRWGDYSNTVVDPVNDMDIWTIQEYAATPSGGIDRFGTWWGMIDLSFSISGFVRTPGGTGIAGVTMGGLPGPTLTDGSGFYSATVDFDWAGTVTPSKSGYTFSPSSTIYPDVTSDQTQDYTGNAALPDLLIKSGTETSYSGLGIFSTDGNNQTKSQNAAPGQKITYAFKIRNAGVADDAFKIMGPGGGSGWSVRYYDLLTSAEVTSQVTGTGWLSGVLAPGASRGIFVKIIPDATVSAGSVNTLLITAKSISDDTAVDVVKTVTTFTATYKTDMIIKAGTETKYTGTGIFNTDGTSQTKSLNVSAGQKAVYTFRAQNAGNANDSFRITGTAGGGGWSVKYYDISTNAEVTSQVTGAGWVSGAVAPKGYPGVYANVRPDASVPLGSTITLIITGTSESDNTKIDVVKAVTTCVAAYKPDMLIKNSADALYIGAGIINLDGTDQTKSQSASAGVKAIYSFRVMNAGYLSDSFKITGTAGGAGWSVRYYDLTSVEITSQVTGAGWPSGTLAPGTDIGFFVKVSPDGTVTSGSIKTLFITATSVANSTKQDVVKAVTTVP